MSNPNYRSYDQGALPPGPGYGYGPPAAQQGDPGTLDLPYYGIGFAAAVKRAFQKYSRFDGRAGRGEYWWYALFNVIVIFGLTVLAIILGLATGGQDSSDDGNLGPAFYPFAILTMIFVVASVVPGISVTMRRLHDQDLSGWLVLLSLIPYLGGFVVMILAIMPGKPSGARYDRVRYVGPPGHHPGPSYGGPSSDGPSSGGSWPIV